MYLLYKTRIEDVRIFPIMIYYYMLCNTDYKREMYYVFVYFVNVDFVRPMAPRFIIGLIISLYNISTCVIEYFENNNMFYNYLSGFRKSNSTSDVIITLV